MTRSRSGASFEFICSISGEHEDVVHSRTCNTELQRARPRLNIAKLAIVTATETTLRVTKKDMMTLVEVSLENEPSARPEGGSQIVIFGMMGCHPCDALKKALVELTPACPVTYVACRPSQSRRLVDEGVVVAFPTTRVFDGDVVALELVGFPESVEGRFRHLQALLAAVSIK